MNYKDLPKIELHLPLDCSLSFDVVQKIDPTISLKEYNESFIAPSKCTDLADYIQRAVKGYELMQTKEQLRWVTDDLFKQLDDDNVIYAEIRFAPLLHTLKGLSPEQAVETVNHTVDECIQKYNIEAGIILCTLRHFNEQQSSETVQLVKKYRGSHVVGFDIAADEAGFPIDNHIRAFHFAKEHNINCTAHVGEAKGPESVWETLRHFHPSRIGHGVRSAEDERLLSFLKEKNIHLEVCPTSNIQVNVFEKIEDHSADMIYNFGISMSLNTDARTISDVTLTDEYNLMERVFHWKKSHFLRCNLEAIDHSFASDGIKEKLKSQIEKGYSSI